MQWLTTAIECNGYVQWLGTVEKKRNSTAPGSFGIRSGRHAHAPGSSSASCCCCNGSVGLNWNTTCIWHGEVWELKHYCYPSGGGLKNKIKRLSTMVQHSHGWVQQGVRDLPNSVGLENTWIVVWNRRNSQNPRPNPTQETSGYKRGIWASFFPQQLFFRGLGLTLYRFI